MPENNGVIPLLKTDLSNIRPLIRNYDKTIKLVSAPYNISIDFRNIQQSMINEIKEKMYFLDK